MVLVVGWWVCMCIVVSLVGEWLVEFGVGLVVYSGRVVYNVMVSNVGE